MPVLTPTPTGTQPSDIQCPDPSIQANLQSVSETTYSQVWSNVQGPRNTCRAG